MRTKRIALYVDELAKEEYKRSKEAKHSAYNDALTYCERYLTIDDTKAFKSDIWGHFEAVYLEKYRSEFPPIVTDAKIFELSDIDTDKIKALQRKYEAINAPDKEPDFTVYANTPEQIERFNATQKICDTLNTVQGIVPINNFALMNGLSRTITHDFATEKLIPNFVWVLSGR